MNKYSLPLRPHPRRRFFTTWTVGLFASAFVSGAAPTNATIVIPAQSQQHRIQTAQLLQHYLVQSCGTRIPIANRPATGMAFHVGRSPYVDKLGLRLDELSEDGFVLKLIDNQNFVIAGPTEWGTEYAVYEFLECALGVRWLLPGPYGTDLPRQRTFELPQEEIREEPAFPYRRVSGLTSAEEREWGRRLRMRRNFELMHNLDQLFPPAELVVEHPEFYPTIDGRRMVPRADDKNWQPNFNAPDLADEAIRRIKRYFRMHPEANSYSLAINDNRNFDQNRNAAAPQRRNRLGYEDRSDEYYRWCNRVVAAFSNKQFGCLAYLNVTEPPHGFTVKSNLTPYITRDRMMWADPRWRQDDQDLTRRWQEAATQTGWYDYVYGSPYCLPRIYPHLMAEYLRWGHEHGVRGIYAEAYPQWCEGPKLYIYLRLLWDPYQDVNTLLDDWYAHCVGPQAAPLLRQYCELWEDFWMRQAPEAPWWPRRPSTYLPMGSPQYLAIVDEDAMQRSRTLLERCIELAETPAQRVRAHLIRDSFAYCESSVRAYATQVAATTQVLTTESEALEAVEDAAQRILANDTRRRYVQLNKNNPLLRLKVPLDRYPKLNGAEWSTGAFWPLLDWVQSSAAVRTRIEQQARESRSEEVRRQARQLLDLASGFGTPISHDAGFDQPPGAWRTAQRGGGARLEYTTDIAHTGKTAVRFVGTLYQPIELGLLAAGEYVAVAHVYVPAEHPPTGIVHLSADLWRGKKRVRPQETAMLAQPGRWTTIVLPFVATDDVQGQQIDKIILRITQEGFRSPDAATFDDIAIFRRNHAS